MATRKSDPVGGDKQGTIEIAYVKLAGNDATLQKVVDAFTTLVSRPANGNVLPAAKRVNTLPAAPKATSNGHGDDALPFTDEENVDVDTSDVQDDVEETAAPAGPKQPRKYNVPTAIQIETASGTSVDEYVKQYKLDSHEEKYLGLAGWLKTHRQQTPMKAGHIVTLYKHLDWTPPADVTMPFRRLSSKKFQWLERLSRGEYQIHQIGESKLAKLKV
jgi:hypothetical protein